MNHSTPLWSLDKYLVITLTFIVLIFLSSCSKKTTSTSESGGETTTEVIVDSGDDHDNGLTGIDPIGYNYTDKRISDDSANLMGDFSDESQVRISHFWHINNGQPYHWDPVRGKTLFEENVSSEGNDGCYKLKHSRNPYDGDTKFDNLQLKETEHAISVLPNETYTLSFMAKSPSVCPSPGLLVNIRDNGSGIFKSTVVRTYFLSKKDTWQEIVFVFETSSNASKVSFQISNNYNFNGQQCENCGCEPGEVDCWPIYIDEFYMGKGTNFFSTPVAKKSFENLSSKRKIDELGNIEIFKEGSWKPFFPVMIYTSNSRLSPSGTNNEQVYFSGTPNDTSDDGYKLYKKLGFNTAAWASANFSLPKVIEAGMYANIDLSYYGFHSDTQTLETDINMLKREGLEDHILFYYHDNEDRFEFPYIEWNDFFQVVRDNSLLPIYQLNGNPGQAAKYDNDGCNLIDVTGTYFSNYETSYVVLDQLNTNEVATSIAQINTAPDVEIKPVIYSAIAYGAKGVGYFWDNPYKKDGSYNMKGDLLNAVWADDLVNIVSEVDKMLPIIRQPHWTSWEAKLVQPNDNIRLGTREFNNKAYIFLANFSSTTQRLVIDVSELGITSGNVIDFQSENIVSSIISKKITININAYDGLLLKIDKDLP